MKRKTIILTLLFSISMLMLTPNVLAKENDSSLVDNIKIKSGTKDDGSFTELSFTLKNDLNTSISNIEFYNDSARPVIDTTKFKVTTTDNPTGYLDYETATEIEPNETIPKGTKLYYYSNESLFNEYAKIIIHLETSDISTNEEINCLLKDDGNASIEIKNKITIDLVTYQKFMDEYKKKYPYIECYIGDEFSMQFAYNLAGNHDSETSLIYVGTIDFANKSYDDLMKEMDTIANNIVSRTPNNSKLESSQNILKALKENGTKISFEKRDDNNILLYSWIFNGNKLTDSDTTLNLDLNISIGTSKNKDKINALVPPSMTSLQIDFSHLGILPTGTTIKLNTGTSFTNNDILDLYYYNPEKNILEKVIEGITVIDGYATFPLTHCSDYVLVVNNEAKKGMDNNVQTSSMNVILYTVISIISAAGIGYILKNKIKEIA
ncbi:MAG: hypothetical protein OSJ65_00135 [Bacilli bacterium]|nr:hypothetical protein [Bacilli bacterium]